VIIVDTALAKREAEDRPIRVGMVGAGFMGRGLANHIVNTTPGMRLVAVANRTLANAERAYTEAGAEFRRVSTGAEVDDAIAAGTPAVLEDAFELLAAEQLDCIVDVTGAVEFGARVTVAAIERGLPVATMNASSTAPSARCSPSAPARRVSCSPASTATSPACRAT
jgi:predicted homoserine dehydrogenase-like protein